MLKMTTRAKDSRSRRLKFRTQAFALGLTSVAFLAACEGTLGPNGLGSDGPGGPGETGDGDGDGTTGDGDLPTGPVKDPETGELIFSKATFDLEGAPFYSRAVLLTNDQWTSSVQTILNLPTPPTQANSFLKPVRGISTFDNNERVLEVNNEMRASYQYAGADVAEIVADEAAITAINAGADKDTFIETLGRRAFRRPLTDEEFSGYSTLFDIGAGLEGEESEFVKGANLVIEGMLQSPNFLYRTELSPDGGRLTGFEVLAKLSYWFLGEPPSDALLDRAAAGEFDTDAGVSTLVEEFLVDPRATEMIVGLYSQLFEFHRFENVLKEDPQYTPAINAELNEVSRLFFQHIYENDLGLDEILTSTEGFVGPLLAEYYGVPAVQGEPVLVELGPERPGFFAQVPYLMAMGDGSNSDAIHRGVYLNFDVMCAKLRLPDGIQVPPLPEPNPLLSDRERVEAHTGIDTCGESCHGGYINPMGYAFENFDGLGRPRTMDADKPVDTTSSYPFVEGSMTKFTGAPELMPLIAESPEAHLCLAKNFLSYALSRDIVESDMPVMEQLQAVSMSEAGSIKGILRELVKSPAFLSRPGAN